MAIQAIKNNPVKSVAAAAITFAGLAELITRVALPAFGIHAPDGFSSLTDGLITIGAPAGSALAAGFIAGLAIQQLKKAEEDKKFAEAFKDVNKPFSPGELDTL